MMAGPDHQPTTLEKVSTLRISDLQYWADENYLYRCFADTGKVKSIKFIRNTLSGLPEGYGFIEFISHEAAEEVLQSYNGQHMPGTEHTFKLNWASSSSGEKPPDAGPDHVILVGNLASDVTDYLLQETFRVNYSSVSGAKVVTDPNTGRSKGYGFVKFADENEKTCAMTEMNGVYCSTRRMEIRAAIPEKSDAGIYSATAYTIPQAQTVLPDSTNTTMFIDNLDPNVTEEELRQICIPLGDIIYVKIPVGKGCGYVQYVSRASAEEAVQRLHGTLIGKQVVRLSRGRPPDNKQVEENEVYDPMNLPDVDKLNASYMSVHGSAMLGRHLWLTCRRKDVDEGTSLSSAATPTPASGSPYRPRQSERTEVG